MNGDSNTADITSASLQVQRGHLVYDPFVGTGSILVAAAYYGAYTLGADIDIRVVRDGKLYCCCTSVASYIEVAWLGCCSALRAIQEL